MKVELLKKMFIILIAVCLLGFFQNGVRITAEPDQKILDYTISLEGYTIIQSEDGDVVSLDSFGRLLIMGKPNLPSRIFSIAIPPGATVQDIEVSATKTILLEDIYHIDPCPIPKAIDGNMDDELSKIYQSNYLEVYTTDTPYPENIGEFLQTSHYRRYNLVDIRVNPFTYYPVSGILEFHTDIVISITYTDAIESFEGIQDSLLDTEQYARHIIANYDESQQWYEPINDAKTGLYDYVIITLDSLTSSVDSLVSWELSKGRTVNVVTTSWINTNYDGVDLQAKMRNFLREKYPSSEWGIEYVLLVGHYDDVPMRRCAQDMGYGQPETDFYYAELSLPDSESWDANGNQQYGDNSDPIDFYAEVSVGRIPFSEPNIVESICDKTVAYEQNNDPSYKKNILLLGAFFWDDTDNAVLMEAIAGQPWMNDWSKTRMYEQSQSSFPSDFDLGYSNVQTDWSSNTYGFVNWAGHGSPTACYEYYPSQAFVDTSTCNSLDDIYPAIIFADACSNHDTDYFNIGQAMMQQGGIGFLGSTKVAYGMPGWNDPSDGSSQSFDYLFTTKVTSGEYSTGAAHQISLAEMYAQGLWYYNKYETFEWGAYLGNPDLYMFLPALEFSFPEGLPEIIDPYVQTTIPVQIHEIGDTYISGSGSLHYRFDGGEYQIVPLNHVNGNLYEAILPSAFCGDTPGFYFSADTLLSGTIYSPYKAPVDVYSCLVGEFIELFEDDFENDLGWSIENDVSLTEGAWERGIPIDDDRGDPPTDYDGSGQCYVTGNSDDEDVDGGITWLISPSFDLSMGVDARIEYALWYTNNFGADPNNDVFKTYISDDDGLTWVLAEVIGPQTQSGWVQHAFMVGDLVSLSNEIKIRFEASDLNDGSVVEAAVDAFKISFLECSPPGPILAFNPVQYTKTMMINESDIITFEVWNAGSEVLNYSITETCDAWIEVDPLIGNSSGEIDIISVFLNTTELGIGHYTCEIDITSNGGSDVFEIDLFVVSSTTEYLDVNQSVFDRGFPIRHALDGDWAAAQDFTPNLGIISSVDLYLRKFGSPEFDLVVELRKDHPEGLLLDSVTFTAGDVGSSWDWLHVDFADVMVESSVQYFIVVPPAPSGVTTSFGYEWGYAFGNQYDDGSFWFTRDGGGLWRDLPSSYEFAFTTYGY